MAKQTYLQLVNKVLTNLRESTVSDLSSNYAGLIGSFVNQAKEKVEDAWNWRCLTQELTIPTIAGTQSYALDGSDVTITFSNSIYLNERSYLARGSDGRAQVFCITSGHTWQLVEYAYEDLIRDNRLIVTATAAPWGFGYTEADQVPTIYFARQPDAVYSISARFVCPQPELSATTDTLIVPYRPVVSFATWMAMQERGEELGTNADLFMGLANDELARAITADVETLQFTND